MIKKHTWVLLIPLLMIFLLLGRVEVRTDITDFFFAGNNTDSAFLINQLNNDKVQRRIILSIAHPDEESDLVFEFVNEFKDTLMNLTGVERTWSKSYEQEQLWDLLEMYSQYQPALFSLNPENEIDAIFNSSNLKTRVERTKSLLLGPDPQVVKSLIQTDPLLLTLDWLENIQSMTESSQASADFSILFLETKAAGMDISAQETLQQQIQHSFEQLNKSFGGRFSIESTGVPIFAIKIKSQINEDIQKVSLLSTLIILFIFIIIFRSALSLILTASMLAFTVGGAVLITQAVFGFVHGLTLALGITLIGICIDYFIHAMINASEGESNQCIENVKKIWPSLILGGCTTMLGYVALTFSGFPGLQQIALFSISGIFIALLITRYIIPSLMDRFSLTLKPRLASQNILNLMANDKVKWITVCLVLSTFLLGFSNLHWSNTLDTLSPGLEQLKLKDSQIRSKISNISPGRFVVVEAENLQSALMRNEKLHVLLNELQRQGDVGEFSTLFPWIASESLQSRNLQAWKNSLDTQNLDQWTSALQAAGFSKDAFSDLLNLENKMLEFDSLKNSPAWSLLSPQILTNQEQTTIITLLGRHDIDVLKQGLDSIQGVRYFSNKDNIDALAISYRQKAQVMLFIGLVAIFVLFLWRFRSFTQSFRVLLPAMLAILFVLGISGFMNTEMNMIHLIGLLLTAAICVDYGIFYFENRSKNSALTFQAITASALTSSASFACLGIAENPALQALAWTVAPGIIIGFLLCPVILRTSR